MVHKQKQFKFKSNDGKEVVLTSKPYTFKTEQVIVDRIGHSKFDKFQETHRMDHNFTLPDIEEDLPRLLNGEVNSVDWGEQDYDEMLSVYTFFLSYKENAYLRQLESEQKTIASTLKEVKDLVSSLESGLKKTK